MKIKAISLKQPWASLIAEGSKTIETRTWPTNYRGELLICSSKNPKIENLPVGMALCVATVRDCRPMTREDEQAAMCEYYQGAYAWILSNIRAIKPFPVKGSLGIYSVDIQGFLRSKLNIGVTDVKNQLGN